MPQADSGSCFMCINDVGTFCLWRRQGERKHLSDGQGTDRTTETVTTEEEQEVFSENAEKVQKEFEQYLDDYFKDAVTEDTMTYNYSIKNGADYGIEEPEVTLGDPGMTEEGIKEDKAEFDKWVDELEKIDRACLQKTRS